jgi:hypothetical protein
MEEQHMSLTQARPFDIKVVSLWMVVGTAAMLVSPQGGQGQEISARLELPLLAELVSDDLSEGNWFGFSVAVDGETAVVGARWGDGGTEATGTAYIYERNHGGDNAWGQVAKLFSGTTHFFEQFGFSVAIDGDTVVVGVPDGETDVWSSGCAFVYMRNAGGANTWGQVAKLAASDAVSDDDFGSSVSIGGDLIVVGAPAKNGIDTGTGAAYIFERDRGGVNAWGEVANLVAADAGYVHQFGSGVGVTGTTVAVGAPEWFGPGAIYLFGRDVGGPGSWGLITKVTASDPDPWDELGRSLAIEGGVLVGGGEAEVYVFEQDAGGPDQWGEVAKLVSPDPQIPDDFGSAVDVSGDLALVGATDPRSSTDFSPDVVYLFQRNHGGPGSWGRLEEVMPSPSATTNGFGGAVAVDGPVSIVGARSDDQEATDAGRAYVHQVPTTQIFADGFETGDTSRWQTQ